MSSNAIPRRTFHAVMPTVPHDLSPKNDRDGVAVLPRSDGAALPGLDPVLDANDALDECRINMAQRSQ